MCGHAVQVAPAGQAIAMPGHGGTSVVAETGAVGDAEATVGGADASAVDEVGGAPGARVMSQVVQAATVLPSSTEQDPELSEQPASVVGCSPG